MKRTVRSTLLAALGVAVIGSAFVLRRDARDARASDPAPPSAAPAARLGVLHGEVDAWSTVVGIADVDPSRNAAPLRTIGFVDHEKGSAVRGALLPGRDAGSEVAMVVASVEAPRGTSYDGALFRVEGGKAVRLCADVARAATPIVTATGRVIVARGVDGPEPAEEDVQKLILRVDDLSIDDVDPATGAIRTLWRGKGYQAFLGATIRAAGHEEIVVYHSTPAGASLLALDPATATTRTLLPHVVPFARDFSFDPVHSALVFADLAPDGASYQVLSLDLSSSSAGVGVLHAAPNEHTMPLALPTGDVAFSSDGDHGLALLVRAGGPPRFRLLSPLGDGSDAATHASADGRWIAVRHTPTVQSVDHPPVTVAYDLSSARVVKLDTPVGHFVDAIGFLPGSHVGGAK